VTIAIHDSDSGFHMKWISSLIELRSSRADASVDACSSRF